MKKKILSIVLILLLSLSLFATLISCNATIVPEQTAPENFGNGVIISNGENYNMVVESAKLLYSEYEANGISPLAESAYRLTATVKPDNAFHKSIDWTVSWKDGNSAWANNKTVTDYVSISVSADTLSANVACLAPFGTTIVVTATSQSNTNATASCMVDYVKRVTKLNTFEIINGGLDFGNTNTCVYTADYTPYTIDAETVISINSIYCNDAWFHTYFVEKFAELFPDEPELTEEDFCSCFIDQDWYSCEFNFDGLDLTFPYNSFWENFMDLGQGGEDLGVMFDSTVYAMLEDQKASGYNTTFLDFYITVKTVYNGVTYSTVSKTLSPIVNLDAFYVGVTRVGVSTDRIIF